MGEKKQQTDRIMAYARLLEKQAGKAVRPYRADGYMNLLTRYGTSKDSAERYIYVPEVTVPDESLTLFYEGNGLFAKIIDAPAEEALKHGFTLDDVSDQAVEDFYREALDELDWEETAMTAIKWARLFGGSIAVMLINDGHGLEEPLDWKNIKSIDDIRVYDRSVIQPDYESMFQYDPSNPFRTRGSRLGMPETYSVYSRYGSFTVHESRCLVFQNGLLPENSSNSIYQFWGMPEYVRINKAIQDAELSHRSAPRMLDRSVQPVYKMKDLSAELATEEGETKLLKRLQTIDMARGMMNSITIDSEGEDYDFRSFQFAGVSDVIDSACNYLSALTNIPQTILFGRSPAGMNATGESDLENWYSFVERIQKRMLKGNLRYLLSIIFQAGVATGEVDEVPKLKLKFNPLWTLSDTEQADLDQKKAQTSYTKAQTAQLYVQMQAIDPTEVRRKLADSSEFDIDTLLDEYEDEDELLNSYLEQEVEQGMGQHIFEEGQFAEYANAVDIEAHSTDPGAEGSAPANAPAATKLPQDMSAQEKAEVEQNAPEAEQTDLAVEQIAEETEQNADAAEGYAGTQGEGKPFSVGVLVVSDGKVLSGTRHNDFGYGLICGPGGHGEKGETPEQAAFRETEEEFGISPNELIPLGMGPVEPDTGLTPYLFLCTDYEGEPDCVDLEIANAKFRTLEELDHLAASLFQPFADGLEILKTCIESVLFFGDGEMHDQIVENIGEAVAGDEDSRKSTIPNISENLIDKSANSVTIKSRTNTPVNEDDDKWITVNGTHIPVDDGGTAIGGPLKGKNFSAARSEESKRSGRKGMLSKASKKELDDAVKSGRIKMKLNSGSQQKHTKGTAKYQAAVDRGEKVSTFSISDDELEKIITERSGSGAVYMKAGGGQIKETIDCGKMVGTYATKDGKEYPTSRITVHHSKNGYHAVPASSDGKKG